MRLELIIRFDYGSIIPWVRQMQGGIRATAGPDTLYCRTPVELRGENMHTVADFTLSKGERVPFSLTWDRTHRPEPPARDPEQLLQDTEQWWRQSSAQCTYDGQWRDAVMRSLITLKALTSATTGGLVAAATTSLPENIGGVRNWDYRYCWLRDATFTLYALITGGYMEEARNWRDWLVHAVDASLLMLPLVGFLPATDPRMVGTVDAIQRRLLRGGFVERYPTMPEVDGLPPGEGVFLLCTFWLVDCLIEQGRIGEAHELFERLLSLRNDVGLLSEEYDPEQRRMVGNFPQAFSHLGLINTARNLTRSGGPAEDRSAGDQHRTAVSE